MGMLRWIYDNKQWVFSGVGVILLSCFIPGLVRFICHKIQQKKINILRANTTRFLDSILVIEEKWEHERQSINPNFDLAASTLSQTGDHALTFWREVSGIFGSDSSFASDLREAAYSLIEASKKRQSLSFDSVNAFWDTGEQAFSMLKTVINRLLEYHKIPWYRRMFGRKNRAGEKEPR
jgi:hypothetical protein